MNIIDYLVNQVGMSQVEIANKLKVNRAQITKWKKGDYVPPERESELMKLAGLFGDDFKYAIKVGSRENNDNWISLVRDINETPYIDTNYPDLDINITDVIYRLICWFEEAGCKLPTDIPRYFSAEEAGTVPHSKKQAALVEFVRNFMEKSAKLQSWLNESLFSDIYSENITTPLTPLNSVKLIRASSDVDWDASKLVFLRSGVQYLIILEADKVMVNHMHFLSHKELNNSIDNLLSVCEQTNFKLKEDPFTLLDEDFEYIFDEDELKASLKTEKTIYDYFNVFEKQLFTEVVSLKAEISNLQSSIQSLHTKLDKLLED